MSKGFIHHIELNVSNLYRTVDFWGWFLEEMNYEPFQEWESGKSWRLDDMYIVFVQAETRYLDIPYHQGQVGLNHLAFHATSRHQVDEITRKLRDRGVTILYADKHPFAGGKEHYAVYFEDPDRMKVELVVP
ncbi:VOC family protein [Peribacillus sp. FSL E2-0159]|uniref:VOC family protein n=1 Tax=Peribacillus sp. FSL E2-0159 TaxID=2975289 RepID=UPI00315A01AD